MLSGYRVLVVEDNAIVAEDVSASIREAEGVVIGPCAGTREARALLKGDSPVDVAVLDVNVSERSITPVLEALHARRVPTLIYTGGALPEACAAGTRTSRCSQSQSSPLASLPSCGGLPGQVWRNVRRPGQEQATWRFSPRLVMAFKGFGAGSDAACDESAGADKQGAPDHEDDGSYSRGSHHTGLKDR